MDIALDIASPEWAVAQAIAAIVVWRLTATLKSTFRAIAKKCPDDFIGECQIMEQRL